MVFICRQRPGTAKGLVFISLEDETGVANAIVTPPMFEKNRLLISEEPFLKIEGILQNSRGVIHVKALKISPLHLDELSTPDSHDFADQIGGRGLLHTDTCSPKTNQPAQRRPLCGSSKR